MKNWDELFIDAKPLFDFLSNQVFFDKPYIGSSKDNKVIFDILEAVDYSTDDSGEKFEDWQNLLESHTPAWPEMPRRIEKKILETLDEMTIKNYSGITDDTLINNMQGDISRLLHCYAFGEVDILWKNVQQAYLDGGMPCGWEGIYPKGRMVILSIK